MRFSLTFLSILSVVQLFGQIWVRPDTIRYNESPFAKLDSVDIYECSVASDFDGGYTFMDFKAFQNDRISDRQLGHALASEAGYDRNWKFSAIPYLGFTFAFGSKGSTTITTKYAHAFTDSMLLNINYWHDGSGGYLRNSSFNRNNFGVKFLKKGRIYSMALNSSYVNDKIGHSGGVADTLNPIFGLEFQQVSKSNANSNFTFAQIKLDNYFDFLADSLTSLGLIIQNNYQIRNRKFEERDTIDGLYQNTYINPDTTADQYNLASIENGAGLFFQRQALTLEGLTTIRNWTYLNLNSMHDSAEWNIRGVVDFNLAKINLHSDIYLNLLGAFNEWESKTTLDLRLTGVSRFVGCLEIGSKAPMQFQRYYSANNYNYQLSEVANQGLLSVKGAYHHIVNDSVFTFNASVFSSTFTDPYVFVDSIWRNDTLRTLSVLGIGVGADVRLWKLGIQPKIQYFLTNMSSIPNLFIGSRVYFNSRILPGRKLNFSAGCDVHFRSASQSLKYIPSMDVFDYTATSSAIRSQMNLHAFLNFGIKDFNFFFRAENLGYFWNDQFSEDVVGYPLTPLRLRLGITWEFYN